MPTFSVVFEGLICHIGTVSKKKRAALVHAPNANPMHNHVPKIVIDNTPHVLQQHDIVSFRGLPGTEATVSTDFKIRVPGLERLITDGSIKPNVERGDPDLSVGAFVELADGTLAAPSAHQSRIKFVFDTGDEESRCVGTRSVFAAITDLQTVDVVIHHRKLNGDPDGNDTVLRTPVTSTVYITNLPQEHGGNHFGMFQTLTTASKMAKALDDATPCPAGNGVEVVTTKLALARETARQKAEAASQSFAEAAALSNPECTNSGWP